MRRHRAAAQIVAIGKPAGQHDQIGIGQAALAMPDARRLMAGGALQRHAHIVLAVRAGEDDDNGFHRRGFSGRGISVTYASPDLRSRRDVQAEATAPNRRVAGALSESERRYSDVDQPIAQALPRNIRAYAASV